MRKDGWTYWTTGLPADSEALGDLQRLADELGVTKAEANRFLLIAYSKASRGQWSWLWGFSAGPSVSTPHLLEAQDGRAADSKHLEVQQRRRRSAVAAAAVALDSLDQEA
jgi:hypothetical protein